MISHRHRCIFVHIPRTAGTSIETLIWTPEEMTAENLFMGFTDKYNNKYQTGGLQHLLASQIRKEVGEEVYDSFYKFAIVRNPWERAVSQYFFMKRNKYLRGFIGMNIWTPFQKYLSLISEKEHIQWKDQFSFVVDNEEKIMVDAIFRFEDLNNCANELGKRLKMPTFKLPVANSTNHSHYSKYYDLKTYEQVSKMYRKDIELFGYSFERHD